MPDQPSSAETAFWALVLSVPIEFDVAAIVEYFSAGLALADCIVVLRDDEHVAQQVLISMRTELERQRFCEVFQQQRFQPCHAECCTLLPVHNLLSFRAALLSTLTKFVSFPIRVIVVI